MPEKLILEVEKLYVTREGEQVRIYATDGGGEYPVHGAIWSRENKLWSTAEWNSEGVFLKELGVGESDIVGPWIEKPTNVNWDAMPAWATVVFMRPNGSWHWCSISVFQAAEDWIFNRPSHAWEYGTIPSSFAPVFSGRWQDSLVYRSGGSASEQANRNRVV